MDDIIDYKIMLKTLNPEQLACIKFLENKFLSEAAKPKTVEQIFRTLTKEQKDSAYFRFGQILERR